MSQFVQHIPLWLPKPIPPLFPLLLFPSTFLPDPHAGIPQSKGATSNLWHVTFPREPSCIRPQTPPVCLISPSYHSLFCTPSHCLVCNFHFISVLYSYCLWNMHVCMQMCCWQIETGSLSHTHGSIQVLIHGVVEKTLVSWLQARAFLLWARVFYWKGRHDTSLNQGSGLVAYNAVWVWDGETGTTRAVVVTKFRQLVIVKQITVGLTVFEV